MDFAQTQYLPVTPPFFALLAAALFVLVILIQIRVLRYAYMQLGLGPAAAIVVLLASLLGSYINIPVAELGPDIMTREREVVFFGMHYAVPEMVAPRVILAVNVGGALIPALLSVYLLSKNALWGAGAVATFILALLCHALAQPVRGVGIALPIFVPPIAAAIVAMIVSFRHAAPLAYAGGSLGVLIGADLMNLDEMQGLGTPVLSIGGAGTFDGVFLTGIMAVLLADLTGRWTAATERSRR